MNDQYTHTYMNIYMTKFAKRIFSHKIFSSLIVQYFVSLFRKPSKYGTGVSKMLMTTTKFNDFLYKMVE